MRKLLIALEDNSQFDTVGGSYNDDAQAVMEENEASNEVNDLTDNVVRSIEIAEALESLVEIIEDKDELSPTERGLIQVAGDMAVAGTGTDSEALVPSTESMSVSVAVETIKERLQQALERIKQAASSVSGKVSAFVDKVINTFKSAKKKIAEVKAKIEQVKSGEVQALSNLSVGNRIIFHSGTESQVAKNSADVKKMSDLVVNAAVGFATALEQNLKVLAKDVGMLQQAKDLKKVEETATKFFNDTMEMAQGLIKEARLAKVGTEGGADVYSSRQQFLGGKIQVTVPSASEHDLSTFEGIQAGATKFSISHTAAAKGEAGEIVLTKVLISDIEALIDTAEDALNQGASAFQRLNDQTKNATSKLQSGGIGNASGTGGPLASWLFSHKMALINNNFVYQGAVVARSLIQQQVFDSITFVNQVLAKSDWSPKAPEGASAV